MKASLYRLARLSLFIFTIEWFYRLGATNASFSMVVLSTIPVILCVFYLYRKSRAKRVWPGQWVYAGVLILFLITGGTYGYYRGTHEMVVPPAIGQPIRAFGYVVSVQSISKDQIINLVITKLSIFDKPEDCNISVSYSQSLQHNHPLTTGRYVLLSGIIAESDTGKKNRKTPLLRLLSPSYRFVGSVKQDGISKDSGGVIEDIRMDLHQAALSQCGQDIWAKNAEPILESIVFGGNDVSNDWHQIFLQAGVLHVLAASGANMLFMERMVTRIFLSIGRLIPFGRLIAEVCVLVFIWLYTLLCNVQPSILRAAWMSSYRVLGHMAGRNPTTLPSLIFSALCIALLTPDELWTISSILSYLATFALDRAIHSIFHNRKRKRVGENRSHFSVMVPLFMEYVKRSVLTSLWVELYTAPLCEALFGQWTPYAMISNLFVEPVLSFLLPLAAIWFMFCFFSSYVFVLPAFNHLFTKCIFLAIRFFEGGLTFIAHFPFALVHFPPLSPVLLLTYYLFITIIPLVYRSVGFKKDRRQNKKSGLSIRTL